MIKYLLIFTIIFASCTPSENCDDYRSQFTGNWRFNGDGVDYSEIDGVDISNPYNISNFSGNIQCDGNNKIKIKYSSNKDYSSFIIDENGNITSSNGSLLGQITNNSIQLNWQTVSSGGGMNPSFHASVVHLTGVKQ